MKGSVWAPSVLPSKHKDYLTSYTPSEDEMPWFDELGQKKGILN